jgi:IS30 family transposase
MRQEQYTTAEKKFKHLTYEKRIKIEKYFGQGYKPARIAVKIGCDRSTVARELELGTVEFWAVGSDPVKQYSADVAEAVREERQRGKCWGKAINYDLEFKAKLAELILSGYSPYAALQEIRNNAELPYKIDICTKTLYNAIADGEFENITNQDLPMKPRRKRGYQKVRCALNNTKGTSISDRPQSVDTREELGHWEIDLVVGKKGTKPCVLTLVERKTRKSIYVCIKNKTQAEVLRALKRAAKRNKGDFSAVFKSITADNGSEFLDFEGMKKMVKCGEIYYAHPYSSWERGSNENGNRMLRRFIPKGTDLSVLTPKRLKSYEDWVNNYPRAILGGMSANMAWAKEFSVV